MSKCRFGFASRGHSHCGISATKHLPMYVKLLPFQELLLATSFSACEQVLYFLPLHVFAGVETAKNPNETAKKTRRNGEKNQEAKM